MESKVSERSLKGITNNDRDTKSTSGSNKDIWSMMSSIDATAQVKDDQTQGPLETLSQADERDTYTLIVGSKNAGKSSLTANFRNSSKVEEIKPTTALDYMFVRLKATSASMRPPVAHMWELASSKCIPEMMCVPLAPERILSAALVIVIDLSVPGDAVPYLIKWLVTLYRVVQNVLKIKEKQPGEKHAVDRLRQEAMARYGNTHVDRDDVTPMPVPLLIVGNKYDTFREEDSIKRKGVTQAIRALAHQYGATLLFTSMKDKNLVTSYRSIMKNFAFRAMGSKGTKEVDPAKALYIPAGSDLFDDIGFPKTARKQEFTREQHEEKALQWKKIVQEYYTPTSDVDMIGNTSELEAKGNEDSHRQEIEKYPETTIDRIRQRKAEELRRYTESRKKTSEKKTKAP